MMSLTALAERAHREWVSAQDGATEGTDGAEDAELLVASDARRREVYSARYRVNAEGYSLVDGPTVSPASEILPGEGPPMRTATVPACTPRPSKSTAGLSSRAAREVHPHAEYLVAAAARLGVENLSEDTSALYLRATRMQRSPRRCSPASRSKPHRLPRRRRAR